MAGAKTFTGHIVSGVFGDYTQESCLGFAGSGTSSATAKYIEFSFDWQIDIDTKGEMTFQMSNMHCRQQEIYNNYYDFWLGIFADRHVLGQHPPAECIYSEEPPFSVDNTGGLPQGTQHILLDSDVTPGTFGPVNLGKATDWSYNEADESVTIWIGGCTRYDQTDPIYPVSIPITLKNGDNQGGGTPDPGPSGCCWYYPWAIFKGAWKSHNRSGGALKIKKSSWSDCMNRYEHHDEDIDHGAVANGQYYNGGWRQSDITGSN